MFKFISEYTSYFRKFLYQNIDVVYIFFFKNIKNIGLSLEELKKYWM